MPSVHPLDGIERTKDEAKRHAATIAAALGSPAGKELLQYMKQVSTYRVMPVSGTSEALWHLEGMRHMVMLLEHWREQHERSSTSGR